MPKSGFRLFEVFGITVYLHWSWIIVAVFEIQYRKGKYQSVGWNIAEYLALFAIVLLHEFGHALACRSVGGKADRIVLWPFGGVAYVSPPMRPGAMLWSIVAGPLVNVALLVTIPFLFLPENTDLFKFLYSVALINIALLVFNMLPIYPLDGGKILWSLLWFIIGCGRALMVASVIGIVGAVGLAGLALYLGSYWMGFIALFAGSQAWMGIKNAQRVRQMETIRRRPEYACPACKAPPPVGPFWVCANCRSRYDTFEHGTVCPTCGNPHLSTTCANCGARSPFLHWSVANQQPGFPVIPQESPSSG